MTALTPGRWTGLRKTSSSRDIFTILAFDQRGTFRKMLSADATYETTANIKKEIVARLSVFSSAVLLDPEYGLSSALHLARTSGLLMALEKSGYTGDSTYRKFDFDPAWSVAKIRKMGASAVKLLAYYHPESGALAEEIEGVIKGVVDECHAHDLPLFLEPVSYSLEPGVSKESAAFAQTRPTVVRETARRLSRSGADILKLEFPVDAAFDNNYDHWRASCEAVSEASAVPWVLLSAGVDFDTFAEQTRIACQAGAGGFLAGRAIWKEGVSRGAAERQQFLEEVAVPRFQRLVQIAEDNARPWTHWYSPVDAPEGWQKTYAVE